MIPEDLREERIKEVRRELEALEQYSSFPEDDLPFLFMTDQFHTLEGNFQLTGRIELDLVAGYQPEAVICTWNTINYAGSPDKIMLTLNHMNKVLAAKGGMLFIESADPATGIYRTILTQYHEKHPDDIPGTSVARPVSREGKDIYEEDPESPGVRRYFPPEQEMAGMLNLTDFDLVHLSKYRVVPQVEGLEDQVYDELVFVARRK